jgi:hypothetical protein
MTRLFVAFIFIFLLSIEGRSQITLGIGASIHRYDQVLCLKVQKPIATASLGVDLGFGVERSLQGALAPQLAVYGQSPVSKKDRHYPCNRPFFAYRLQIDMQRASMTNVNYALYLGLGYPIGKAQRFDIQLGLGGVYEKMYGVISPSIGKLPFFLNPQAQLNFHLLKAKQ